MGKNIKQFLLSITIVLLISLSLYYLKNETEIFNTSDENNQNIEQITIEDTDTIDLHNLVSKQLIVPEQYKEGLFRRTQNLNLPENFEISVFASGMNGTRFIDFDEENNLYATNKDGGNVVVIPDTDNDGVGDEIIVIAANLKTPHGIDYYDGDLYLAEEDKISVFRDIKADGTYSSLEILVDNLPTGGHTTRTVIIGPDKKMYVSIGSTCNVCEEADARRAAIVRYDLDGKNEEIFATGLRNSVGIEFRLNEELEYELWGVNNGRDRIGDNIPPEEVNIIKKGEHYGWPYCYGQGIANPEYPDKTDFCMNDTVFPVYEMQAHSAPLGLDFYREDLTESNFPSDFMKNLFIGFHGSWNRTEPTGYKVVRIDTSSETGNTIDFVTGWLNEDGTKWGRPVDVEFDNYGYLYITDDEAGAIYRVSYSE